jgi:GWxTD domain-containing protein
MDPSIDRLPPMPRIVCALAAVLLALTAAAPAAEAQSAAQRAELERFRDSLAAISEVPPLRALEADLIARARQDRSNAMIHLRLGFLALRMGDLTEGDEQRRHFDEAGGEFEWATQEQPNWPYGWYGLGFAELGVGDSELPLVGGFQTMLGRDALTRSATAFARSAEVDPGFVAGLSELTNTALKQRVNARADVALAALRRASRTSAAASPEVLLARGRIERAAGSIDSSAAALTRLLARDSSNTMARYELARTRFLQDDGGAQALWYRALSGADSATLVLLREDLAAVMPDTTLERFDRLRGTPRVQMVREFWESRDDDELQPRGGRVAEHYRRLDQARRNYRLVSTRRQYGIAERYRSSQSDIDDRGVIYIRHGEPDEKARYNAPGIEGNESWLYRRESGDLIFHFVARDDVQDFRLVESLFDALDYQSTLAMRDAEGLLNDARDDDLRRHTEGLLRSRESLDPIYSRLLGAGRSGNAQLLTEERRAGARAIALGTTTDSWPLNLGDRISADVVALAVGSDMAGPALQIAFAVPGSGLTARQVDGGFAYPVRLRASVIALDGSTVAVVDTTRTFLAREPVSERRLLLGRLPVSVPPGTFTVRLAIQTDQGGLVTIRDTVRVASPLGPEPGLSDLALGTRSVFLPWPLSSGDTAWVNPTGIFRRDEPAQLYFEVTGLKPSESYEILLEVRRPRGGSILRRVFGGGGTAIKASFDQVHPGGVDRVVRELDFDRLSEGDYVLEVTVRTTDGRQVRRSHAFRVTE